MMVHIVNLILLVMFLSSDFHFYFYFLDIDLALKANNIYLVFCLTVHRWKTISSDGCVSGIRGHCLGVVVDKGLGWLSW